MSITEILEKFNYSEEELDKELVKVNHETYELIDKDNNFKVKVGYLAKYEELKKYSCMLHKAYKYLKQKQKEDRYKEFHKVS